MTLNRWTPYKRYIKSESITEFGKLPYRENEIIDFQLDITKFKLKTKKDLYRKQKKI